MTPARSMSVASARTQAPRTLASSPVRGEFTLRDYIDWHIKKAPEDAQLFDRAYYSMKEEGLLIEHIQEWKDINDQQIFQQWKNLGIGIGYGRRLAENCTRFRIEWEHVIASPSHHSHESRGHTLPVRSLTQKKSANLFHNTTAK